MSARTVDDGEPLAFLIDVPGREKEQKQNVKQYKALAYRLIEYCYITNVQPQRSY